MSIDKSKLMGLVEVSIKHSKEVNDFMDGMQAKLLPVPVREMIKAQADITKQLALFLSDVAAEI